MAPVYGMMAGLYPESSESSSPLGAEIPLAIAAHRGEEANIVFARVVANALGSIFAAVFIGTAECSRRWRTQKQNDVSIWQSRLVS
jgi:hypothetical protein